MNQNDPAQSSQGFQPARKGNSGQSSTELTSEKTENDLEVNVDDNDLDPEEEFFSTDSGPHPRRPENRRQGTDSFDSSSRSGT